MRRAGRDRPVSTLKTDLSTGLRIKTSPDNKTLQLTWTVPLYSTHQRCDVPEQATSQCLKQCVSTRKPQLSKHKIHNCQVKGSVPSSSSALGQRLQTPLLHTAEDWWWQRDLVTPPPLILKQCSAPAQFTPLMAHLWAALPKSPSHLPGQADPIQPTRDGSLLQCSISSHDTPAR